MHINRTTVMGHLGADSKINTLPNGSMAINFSVCHKRKFKSKTGEQHETVTWFECTIWRGPGQNTDISDKLRKGAFVLVEGEISCRIADNSFDLQPRAQLTLRVNDVTVINTKETVAE